MMLLGTLPPSLFQPLAAPGAPVYVRLLLDIYRQTQARPDPLSRDLILSLIYQQLAEPQALALTDDAQSDESVAADQIDPLTARASAIVRYLDRCGWLKGETLSDFNCAVHPARLRFPLAARARRNRRQRAARAGGPGVLDLRLAATHPH